MLARLYNYVVLPKEITPFEHQYLTRLNRIALIFFWCHIPVFVGVAWLSDTGPLLALALTVFTLIGPTVAYKYLSGVRNVSMVYGFTAMGMGGLLVHFGQGPVQIEMHFYFFALLAMLSLFANPMVNIVAAITVAVHHGVLWYLLPSSVFNYDAPFWVVGVHAIFVVVETFACCFISRSFFNDVIGLEKIVQARTAELDKRNQDLRLVLDNVGQGFLTVDRAGVMSTERSAVLDRWLGPATAGESFASALTGVDQEVADWFELGLESVMDGVLPTEVALDQLPKRLGLPDATLSLDYQPILDHEGSVEKLLVVISDITHLIQSERAEREQREMMEVFGHIMKDKTTFLEFLAEGDDLVEVAAAYQGDDLAFLKRMVHTLKGNASLFGLHSVAELCHTIEDEIVSTGDLPRPSLRQELRQRWADTQANLERFLGDRANRRIELDDADYEAILRAVLAGEEKATLAEMIRAWKLEPMGRRLDFVAEQAEALARRLGKEEITFETEPGSVRLEADLWSSFWSTFQHAVRNAIDHGIEDAEVRRAQGKSTHGTIRFSTYTRADEFVVEITDDGHGVDWQKVAQRAQERGIPATTQEELREALFADGVSTKDIVTQFSGRGVGMSAVREECAKRGGLVEVVSRDGEGTTVRCRFPMHAMTAMEPVAVEVA